MNEAASFMQRPAGSTCGMWMQLYIQYLMPNGKVISLYLDLLHRPHLRHIAAMPALIYYLEPN